MIFEIADSPFNQIDRITKLLAYLKDGLPGRRYLETALKSRKNDLSTHLFK